MIEIIIPGRNQTLALNYLLLDINGTIALDGELMPGTKECLQVLRSRLNIYLLSADTFGCAEKVAGELGIEFYRVDSEHGGLDKKDFLMKLGKDQVVAIGNGFNDLHMLENAALSICVIGREGCSGEALRRADIAVNHIIDALELLIDTRRLVATLRA